MTLIRVTVLNIYIKGRQDNVINFVTAHKIFSTETIFLFVFIKCTHLQATQKEGFSYLTHFLFFVIVDGSYQFVSENILEGKHKLSAQAINIQSCRKIVMQLYFIINNSFMSARNIQIDYLQLFIMVVIIKINDLVIILSCLDTIFFDTGAQPYKGE